MISERSALGKNPPRSTTACRAVIGLTSDTKPGLATSPPTYARAWLSTIVIAMQKHNLLAILYLDPDSSFDYSEIMYSLDVSDVIIRHKQDHVLLVYSIKKAFNHSY